MVQRHPSPGAIHPVLAEFTQRQVEAVVRGLANAVPSNKDAALFLTELRAAAAKPTPAPQ